MKIFRNLEQVPSDFSPSIVSVGNFDGVHRAHLHVLHEIVRRAKEIGGKSLAVTFDPHPARILRPDTAPRLLTPLAEKIKLIEESSIDGLLILTFDHEFSMLSPQEFVSEVLAKGLGAREVHEGFNFRFGHNADGRVSDLVALGSQYGFEVKVYSEMKLRGKSVSSSTIRKLIQSGDVDRARHLLGRVFSITAPPASGRGYGNKFTVPTINLGPYDELVPANGVYVTRTRVGDITFESVTNVGNRPTFGKDSFAIESHFLDFREFEFTPESEVEISFLKWLRPEIKWPDVDALRAQIAKDVQRARRYFHLSKLM